MPSTPRNAGTGRIPGLAVASLVLGILGLVGSVVVVGALLALVGLLLGAIHLARNREGRGMGWAGVWVSIVAVVAAAGFATFYVWAFRGAAQQMGQSMRTDYANWVGRPAPDLEVTTLDGDPLRLSSLKGRRVVVDVWATWCGPCVMEIPHFIRIQKEAGTNELMIVGVSDEDRAVLKKFADEKGINYPIASTAGARLPEPFGTVQAFPTTFFLDRDGTIRHVAVGSEDYETLKRHALGEGQ